MSKRKRKLSAAERRAKKHRKKTTKVIFVHGKQVRVKREPMIDGLPAEEFIRRNADDTWLAAAGMWEVIEERRQKENPWWPGTCELTSFAVRCLEGRIEEQRCEEVV